MEERCIGEEKPWKESLRNICSAGTDSALRYIVEDPTGLFKGVHSTFVTINDKYLYIYLYLYFVNSNYTYNAV